MNNSSSVLKLAPFFRTLNSEAGELHPYVHMFREDITSGLIPLGGRSRNRPEFIIQIDGPEDCIKNAMVLINSFSNNDSRDLQDGICCAIEEIAKSLAWEATSKYELMLRHGKFTAHHVSSRRTIRLPLFTVQVVPIGEISVWKRRFLYCKNSSMWSVSMPKSLGGPKGYNKSIKNLKRVPPGSMPQFVVQDIRRHINSTVFDFEAYSDHQILFVNKATLNWNWHRRDWSDEKQCEYYRTYKRAMFKCSQILLREHITVQINKLLKRLRINCTITVNGLTSSSEMMNAIERLRAGEIMFSDIYDLIYDK